MIILTTAQMRRYAIDQIDNYKDTHQAALAEAYAEQLRAEADLQDSRAGADTGTAPEGGADIVVNYPIIGNVRIRGGRRMVVEHAYNGEGEAHGIHTAWEWIDSPSNDYSAGTLCRMYIGTASAGPLAMYDAGRNQWQALKSRGNYGKRYACGGNWSGAWIEGKPEILKTLEGIMDKATKIKQAGAKLRAAKLRVSAAHTDNAAAAHMRQAAHPIYTGQDIICSGKAAIISSIADQKRAEADLIEAEAGL